MKRMLAFALVLPVLCSGIALAGDDEKKKHKKQEEHGEIKAAVFVGTDSTGKEFELEKYKDKTVVLEWTNPECPYVQKHYKAGTMKKLAEKYKEKGVVWIAINSTASATPAAMEEWRKNHDIGYAILMDSDQSIGKKYHAKTTPHMFVIHKGEVVYQGAIDDDQRGEKDHPVNYVAQALDEILAGKEVSVSKKKPYGCIVKYSKSVN